MRFLIQTWFCFDSENEARNLFEVLEPEIKSDARVQSSFALNGSVASLVLQARDRSALRAAVNSYGRWMSLYERIGGIE